MSFLRHRCRNNENAFELQMVQMYVAVDVGRSFGALRPGQDTAQRKASLVKNSRISRLPCPFDCMADLGSLSD